MFKLSVYPWVHCAQFNGTGWDANFIKNDHLTMEEESKLDDEAYNSLMAKRNQIPNLPLVNYTSQYGLGCFEGLKAFPQKDGSLKIFRPDRNCSRMASSMKGLRMPPVPEDLLLDTICEIVRRNWELGFTPTYNSEWEKDYWQDAEAVYIRPFAYSEPGIGVSISYKPWVITICTTVASYFILGENKACTTQRIRATPKGTGWIKTAGNYVTSTLAKTEAADAGYMEAVFLDAVTRKNIEEGTSCNFFAIFPDKTIVTPLLKDTILPGINRESIITLAREMNFNVVERDLPVAEVLDDAVECFVTGTAAGIAPLGSLTHEGRETQFSSLAPDSASNRFLRELKGIQFGAVEDRHGWMLAL